MIIQNFSSLSTTPSRKIVLELIEKGLESIQPDEVFKKNVSLNNNSLSILDSSYDLNSFDNVYLIGFGKGSARNAKLLEDLLGDKLTGGFVIDTEGQSFKKIQFTRGTHPIISKENVEFTQEVISKYSTLSQNDLVIVIVCGGGSAMFEYPHSLSLEKKIELEKKLLKSGADIIEMNKVRQHLSSVKGGGLAQILYPATVATLIFSDVPGNDISYIASGPTVKNDTTIDDALAILQKFNIYDLPKEAFIDNPKDDKYFEKVQNHIVLSNFTALNSMEEKANQLGIKARIYSDKFQGEAKEAGKKLIEQAQPGEVLLVGGETTVKVTGDGIGGRNQEVVLGALSFLDEDTIIASVASDGWDNNKVAGAIGDSETIQKATDLGVEPLKYLEDNNSFEFFQKTGDAIMTGRLPSNISDIIIVLKI